MGADWEVDPPGWHSRAESVCGDCVADADEYLRNVVVSATWDDEECSFCDKSPAAPLDVLTEAFFNGLATEYASAGDEGAYFEGELVAESWDGQDLVEQYFDDLGREEVYLAVRDAADLDEVWVRRDFVAPRQDDALRDGWNKLCEQVMHHTRYLFWRAAQNDEEYYGPDIPPARILDILGGYLPQVGVVRTLPSGSRFWRARAHVQPKPTWGAAGLGTAPPELAKQANRMSPAGIPLFYGADSPEAALAEIAGHAAGDKRWATYAQFETSRDCRIVDFTQLPEIPSMYDIEQGHIRRPLIFLHEFVDRLSARHDGREHLEYVPTQVVTEYLLRVFREEGPIVGLSFRSAAEGSPNSSVCTVLDVSFGRCIEQELGWADTQGLRLGLDPASLRTVPLL